MTDPAVTPTDDKLGNATEANTSEPADTTPATEPVAEVAAA